MSNEIEKMVETVVAKKRFVWKDLIIVMGCIVTTVSVTVAILESQLIKGVNERETKTETKMESVENRQDRIENNFALFTGEIKQSLTDLRDNVKDMNEMLKKHMGVK
jgi:hypothetical protein